MCNGGKNVKRRREKIGLKKNESMNAFQKMCCMKYGQPYSMWNGSEGKKRALKPIELTALVATAAAIERERVKKITYTTTG